MRLLGLQTDDQAQLKILERAKGFEPSTPTLASLGILLTFINDAERFSVGKADFHWISAVLSSHSFTRPHASQQRFCVTPAAENRYPRGFRCPGLARSLSRECSQRPRAKRSRTASPAASISSCSRPG